MACNDRCGHLAATHRKGSQELGVCLVRHLHLDHLVQHLVQHLVLRQDRLLCLGRHLRVTRCMPTLTMIQMD